MHFSVHHSQIPSSKLYSYFAMGLGLDVAFMIEYNHSSMCSCKIRICVKVSRNETNVTLFDQKSSLFSCFTLKSHKLKSITSGLIQFLESKG